MNRTGNALRNMAWGLFQKFVTILLPFLTRTVLIKVLGAEYLGLSSLFTSILGLLSLAELGVSNAIISTMYKPIAENDEETICALMAFYRKAYYVIGIIIAIIGIAVMPFLKSVISGEIPSDINIYVLYVVYLANTVISYFLFAYKNCLFIAHQRNDINSKIQTGFLVIQNFVQILLVIFLENYYWFVIVIPIFSILINIFTAYRAKKMYPQYVCKGTLNKEIRADVKQRVMGLMLGKISSTIRSAADSLFISAFLGLKFVAMYSNYIYVVTTVAGVIQIIEGALIASVGNSIAVDSSEKNYHDFIKFTFILQWIVGWCSICILCLEQPFMQLWVGKQFLFNDLMVVLCALYLFINCIGLIRSIYTQALGMWWELRYLSLIDIFVNIFLNFILGKSFGAYGILLATICDIAFVSIPWTTYFLYKKYFGKDKYLKYMCGYLKYLFVAAFIGIITWFICSNIVCTSLILKLSLSAVICVVIPNLGYYIVFNKSMLFKETISFLKIKMKNYYVKGGRKS